MENDLVITEQLLNYIRMSIESMEIFNHIEVLKILHASKITLNENKNGNYINLSEINKETIQSLITYINYVNIQENTLKKDEIEKESYKKQFFLDK
jgi:hypothetical protein